MRTFLAFTLIVFSAALALALAADEPNGWFISGALKPSAFVLSFSNEAMVTIKADGTIEYGPNYHPDEAAKLFWAAVGAAKCKEVAQ